MDVLLEHLLLFKQGRGIPQHFESFGTVLVSNMGRSTLVGL
jgi:hypothetical protein